MTGNQVFTILQAHVPAAAVEYCFQLWKESPFELKITRSRNTKVGDFTSKGSRSHPRITLNNDLNAFLFLQTYVHEVAHLRVYLSLGNREVTKNLGFNVVYRWQQSFRWESPLANGIVPAYFTLDAQVSYKVPQWKSRIKVGGSNIFNNRYIQYAAGPTIGGLYYVAITVDGLLNK